MREMIDREVILDRKDYTAAEITNQFIEVDIGAWNERWCLSASSVICRGCGGSQLVSKTGVTFDRVHAAGCRYGKSKDQMPLNRLGAILSHWKLEEWDWERDDYIISYSA